MSVDITTDRMTSDATTHHALRVDPYHDLWAVSWLPADRVSRNQAMAAMTLAELVAIHALDHGVIFDPPTWLRIDSLAAELNLSAAAAIASLGA